MDIRDLHAIVHQGQDRGVTVKETLGKYKTSKRDYYTGCKNNNLPPWRSKNQSSVLVKKGVRQPKGGLSGGSLEGWSLQKTWLLLKRRRRKVGRLIYRVDEYIK